MAAIVYLVIPCYNEEAVLPLTAPRFISALREMIRKGLASEKSRVLFVNDGSRDGTLPFLRNLTAAEPLAAGISLSRNRGHQNALFAGLMEAAKYCDVSISLDADGQDDLSAAERMLREYEKGAQVVYGIRSSRKTDSYLKRASAQGFYRLMTRLGAETIYNHADYRLLSVTVLRALSAYEEKALYLRGLIPQIGYPSASVYYERHEREAGVTHYPLKKMLRLAENGLVGFSQRPLQLIPELGGGLMVFSAGLAVAGRVTGKHRPGSGAADRGLAAGAFFAGLNLLSLGILGSYTGAILEEVKARPRYFIEERMGLAPEESGAGGEIQ